MNVICALTKLIWILWEVDEGILIEFSIGSRYDTHLPIEALLLDPVVIKRIILDVGKLLVANELSHFVLYKLNLFFLTLKAENVFHGDADDTKCPLEHNLLLFDFLIHEVSCKEEDELRVEGLFSDLLDEKTKLKNINISSLATIISCCFHRQVYTAILEDNETSSDLEEDILPSLSWS